MLSLWTLRTPHASRASDAASRGKFQRRREFDLGRVIVSWRTGGSMVRKTEQNCREADSDITKIRHSGVAPIGTLPARPTRM